MGTLFTPTLTIEHPDVESLPEDRAPTLVARMGLSDMLPGMEAEVVGKIQCYYDADHESSHEEDLKEQDPIEENGESKFSLDEDGGRVRNFYFDSGVEDPFKRIDWWFDKPKAGRLEDLQALTYVIHLKGRLYGGEYGLSLPIVPRSSGGDRLTNREVNITAGMHLPWWQDVQVNDCGYIYAAYRATFYRHYGPSGEEAEDEAKSNILCGGADGE